MKLRLVILIFATIPREASPSMPFGAKADSTKPASAGASGGTARTASAPSGTSGPVAREQRVTKQRLAVSAALDELPDFVSTQELYRILQNQGVSVSLATAYRILQSLADEGLVDVLRNGDGEAVYRRCAVTGHHHHLLCRNCGKAVEVEAPAVETWAARTASEHGFTEVAHTVEIFGLCPDCTARKAAGNL
jgi:Fur family ferric uptake transcriptional regulator